MLRLSISITLLTALSPLPSFAARGGVQKTSNAKAAVAFQFDAREDGEGNPHTKVFLVVGARRVLIRETTAKFSDIGREEYKSHGVPAAALAACSGWWAGAGEDFYVIRRNGKLVVYSRSLDEQAPASAYKRLKTI